MFLALLLLNIFHPGHFMSGPQYDIPGRKERKLRQVYNKLEMDSLGQTVPLV